MIEQSSHVIEAGAVKTSVDTVHFSPDDLLAHKKTPSQLLMHGGPKVFAPGDSGGEDKILTSLLQEQRDVLQEQRVSKKYCTCSLVDFVLTTLFSLIFTRT